MRAEMISRNVRERFYYSIPDAGALIGLSRTQSYRAAENGQMPTKRAGKLLFVPREVWDREVRRLLGRVGSARPQQKTA